MVSNLVEYLDNSPTEELFVDTSRNKKLQINFDIVVPTISCDCKYQYLYIQFWDFIQQLTKTNCFRLSIRCC